jgi:hypothetical protein
MRHWDVCTEISNRTWKPHLISSVYSLWHWIEAFLDVLFIIGINMLLKIHYCVNLHLRAILNTFHAIIRSYKSTFFLFTQSAEDMLALRKLYLAFQIWIGHTSLVMRNVIVLSIQVNLLCNQISDLWSCIIDFLWKLKSI